MKVRRERENIKMKRGRMRAKWRKGREGDGERDIILIRYQTSDESVQFYTKSKKQGLEKVSNRIKRLNIKGKPKKTLEHKKYMITVDG